MVPLLAADPAVTPTASAATAATSAAAVSAPAILLFLNIPSWLAVDDNGEALRSRRMVRSRSLVAPRGPPLPAPLRVHHPTTVGGMIKSDSLASGDGAEGFPRGRFLRSGRNCAW